MFGMAAKFVRLHDGLAWLLLDFDEIARPLAWPMQSPQIPLPSLLYYENDFQRTATSA